MERFASPITDIYGDYKTILSNSGILTVALGTLMAKAFDLLVGGLIDDIITPTVNPIISRVTQKTGDFELSLFGINLKIGSFLNTVVKFILYVVAIVMTLNLFKIELNQ